MTRVGVVGLVLLLAVAAVTVAPALLADRETADYFAQRGDKAVKEKKWAEAQENYRKALDEEDTHLPARVGLGEAFFGAGDRGAAVEAWRRAVADAGAARPFPPAWSEPLSRAKKRLAEVDTAGIALARIVDRQVEALVALAERWSAKDPEVGALAARDALRLRPSHARAAAVAAKIGAVLPPEWIPLFDGTGFTGWDITDVDQVYTLVDGEAIGECATGCCLVSHEKSLHGDFHVRVVAKIVQPLGKMPFFGFGGALHGYESGTWVGLDPRSISLKEQERSSVPPTETFGSLLAALPKPFDPSEWTTYELQFRGKEVRVLVNGQEVCVRERAKGREEGTVGLLVQQVRVAIRRVEVMQR